MRIAVARASRKYPALVEMLRDGRLHLSAIAKPGVDDASGAVGNGRAKAGAVRGNKAACPVALQDHLHRQLGAP